MIFRRNPRPGRLPKSAEGCTAYTVSNRLLPLLLHIFLYLVGLLLSTAPLLILIAFLYTTFGKAAAITGVCIAVGLVIFWIYECIKYVIHRKNKEDFL